MLVAGGLLDQPLEWFVYQSANAIHEYLTRSSREGFKTSDMLASDYNLQDQINAARKRLREMKA